MLFFARSLQYEEIIPVDQSRSARYKSPGFLILVFDPYLPRKKRCSVSSHRIPYSVLVLYQLGRFLLDRLNSKQYTFALVPKRRYTSR